MINPNIKKLHLVSCDIEGDLNISKFTELEELHLLYTLDSLNDLKESFDNLKIKKLAISGDLMSDKKTQEYLKELRGRGIKVEIIGPQI